MATEDRGRVDYFAGLDLGRSWEYTALAIVERSEPPGVSDLSKMTYAVRHLERFTPGTPYPDVFARAVELFAGSPLSGSMMLVDYTAVGRTVVEALRRTKVKATLRPVAITAGHSARPDERGGLLVPRTELAGTMQFLLQSRRIKVAESLPEVETLVSELETFKAELPSKPDDDVAAWREKEHDDLVLAVALAAWEGDRHGRAVVAFSGGDDDERESGWRRVGTGFWPGVSRW